MNPNFKFDFNPLYLHRVYWDDKRNLAILQFQRMRTEIPIDPVKKDEFFKELKAYCLNKKIEIGVYLYEEN